MGELEVTCIYYEDFFLIAVESYQRIIRLEKERKKIETYLPKSPSLLMEDIAMQNRVDQKNSRIQRLVMVIIISCACSLEGYINDYAIDKLSKNYLKTYLDKLDLFSKWIVIPRITRGTQLNPGSSALQDLSWLINMRNKLVHSKSRKIEIDDIKDTDFVGQDDAKRAIDTVKNLVRELKKIDNDIDIEWTTGDVAPWK